MSQLKPVRWIYEPDYPRFMSPEEIKEYLRPGLSWRFSSATLMAGALLASAASGCAPGASAQENQDESSTARKSTYQNPELAGKVARLAEEILGTNSSKGFDAFWSEYSYITPGRELPSNPIIKYPLIPISFGNSCNGIFDVEAARDATTRLFSLYGITLEKDVQIKGDGYEFQADGFDEERRIGFKLLMPEGKRGLMGTQEFEPQDPENKLDAEELKKLDEEVRNKKLQLFVADANRFPLMDGDQTTPLACYMASIVDYLNWIHDERRIDPSDILGKIPGGVAKRSFGDSGGRFYPTLPGCDFEAKSDLSNWSVDKGTASLCKRWPGFKASSLQLSLEPGGKAVYSVPVGTKVLTTPPEDSTSMWEGISSSFGGKVFIAEAEEKEVILSFALEGENGQSWIFEKKVPSRVTCGAVDDRKDGVPFEVVKRLIITSKSEGPVVIYVDTLGLSPVTITSEDR